MDCLAIFWGSKLRVFFLGASERFSVAFDVHVVGAFCDQLKFELSDC